MIRWTLLCLLLGVFGATAHSLPEGRADGAATVQAQDDGDFGTLLPKGRLPCASAEEARLRIRVSAGPAGDTPGDMPFIPARLAVPPETAPGGTGNPPAWFAGNAGSGGAETGFSARAPPAA